VAEAKPGALFLNSKQATIFQLTLREIGHPQPHIPINCDNSTTVGIANNTIKRQHSRSMEMRFFWVADAVEQGKFTSNTFPAKKTLQIIEASTTLVLTTSLSDRGIFTNLHLHANYQELPSHPL
jgi:hypothetical protein